MHNGEVKIITGSRRSGKSWILKKVFYSYLISQGVKEQNIISISLDTDEPDCNEDLLKKENLKKYIYDKITSDEEQYYIFLDEIPFQIESERKSKKRKEDEISSSPTLPSDTTSMSVFFMLFNFINSFLKRSLVNKLNKKHKQM